MDEGLHVGTTRVFNMHVGMHIGECLVHSNAVRLMYTYTNMYIHTQRFALFCFATRIGSWLNMQGS